MNKIIGGEYKIENYLLEEKNDTQIDVLYSSGRCVLYCILQNERLLNGNRVGNKILIPNYLCDSITRTVIDVGWDYQFYEINESLKFNVKDVICNTSATAILLINYFGIIDLAQEIKQIKHYNSNIVIIEDDVQAYYEYKKTYADYSFTSLRKWFPCPDGALINTKKELLDMNVSVNNWGKYKFAGNILKNYINIVDDSICLELLNKGESILESNYISKCNNISKIIYSNTDVKLIADKRKANALYLHKGLLKLGIKHLYNDTSVPLFVPIFIDRIRDILRKKMYDEHVFLPIHWPKISDKLNGNNVIYNTELSLICDQRYNIEDMKKQINILEKFICSEEL